MVVPYDTFNRGSLGDPLGTSTSGHAWTLRDTGPYDDAGATIAQEPSIITLSGSGTAIADDTQRIDHLQFATLDHGTGDGPADGLGWEIGFSFTPTIFTGVGIVFRWQDSTHYWNAFLYNGALAPEIFLERQNGPDFASASPRINVPATEPVTADSVLRVVAVGDDIEVYWQEVLHISVTNSSFATSPHHGISYFHSGGGIDWFGRPSFDGGLTVGPLHITPT